MALTIPPSPSSRPLGLTPKNFGAGVRRAQNFSVSKLNYQKDIANAKVSVNQLLSRRGTDASNNNYYSADADDKRYEYVRRLAVSNRRKREAAGAESIYDAGIKTGGLFKTSGASGLRRHLIRMRYDSPGTFKNLSPKDRQYFVDLVEKHAKALPAGSGFGRYAKRDMKLRILRDRRAGKINVEDEKDFNKMIDELPGVKRGLL